MNQTRTIALASAFAVGMFASQSYAAGPGFGNLSYTDAELFKHVSLFDNSNGTPSNSPSKAYGHNVALYLDGYLVFTFAPDSGLPTGGWLTYDVSNPRQPKLMKAHRGQDTDQLREPHSLPLALIGDKTYVGVQSSVGIQIWDMTDPLNVSIAGRLSLNGVNAGDYTDVSWQLSWQFPYLYVAGGNRGVYIVDTSDVTKPKLVKQVQTSQLGGFRVGPIFAVGDRLFLGNMDENARFSLLDLSDPTDPQLLDTVGTQIRYYAMSVLGDLVVGAGRDGDLLVYEDRAGSLESVANHRIAGDGLYLSFQDDFIHYGQTGSYKKLSFSDPKQVQVLGNTVLPGHDADHGQVTPFGNLVFIGNDHGTGSGLVVHQKAPDTTPPKVHYSFPTNEAVKVPTNTAIVATFSDNLDPATLRGANVRLETANGEAVSGTATYLFNTVHYRANAALAANTTYRFSLSTGVKDVMGNALAAPHEITFSTGSAIMSGTGGSGGVGGSSVGGSSNSGGSGTAGAVATGGVGGAASGGTGSGGTPSGGASPGGSSGTGGGSASGGVAGTATGGSASTGGSSVASGGAAGAEPPAGDDAGCSCRTVGGARSSGAWLLSAVAAACIGRRRRRS